MTDRIETLIVLGAGGDLTSRLLLPGLASLLASTRGEAVQLIGVDRGELTDDAWQAKVTTAFAPEKSALGTKVGKKSFYLQGDATVAADLQRAFDAATGRIALYFALPPAVTILVVKALATLDLPKGIVFALEKPFGTDLTTARALNRKLEKLVPETQVFRVDHFLGKSTVLNLLGLRFANRVFEPLMSSANVEKVEITFDEQLALEGRAGYYDKAGALTDMIQSHLLLVLALAAMEPPASVSSDDLRGGMAQVLRATRVWDKDGTSSGRAHYTAGTIDGRTLPAYTAEAGVDATRETETLAEITLAIDNWRWAGVPFVLRSGKAIGEAKQEIVVTLREVPHLPIGLHGPKGPAQLRISMKPATLALDLMVNGEDDPFELERVVLESPLRAGELNAYGEVLSGLLDGDLTLSVRGDVAEQCWRIIGPVVAAWKRGDVPLKGYAAGSGGPASFG
jgi:glucose-6-phosphate 1-dehydrogenase